MKIQSLGRRTDLIFAGFGGRVTDRGNYTLVQTPSNPTYHWGNYIIFDQAPTAACMSSWIDIFDAEFPYDETPHHYLFTWDSGKIKEASGDYQEFLSANFDFDSAVVLTTSALSTPPHFNPEAVVRSIQTTEDWEAVIKLQVLCADPRFANADYIKFKRKQFHQYRQMSESGLGNWYGAYIGDQLTADLGIYAQGGIARYQNVGTHPDYRRQGICGTLVYTAGMRVLNEGKASVLVMEADTDYHAARVYESVGFEPKEINHSLSWWSTKSQ